MKLTDALFSKHGCFVLIDGWRADVSSKWTLLEAGLCNVQSVDTADAAKAEALMQTPVSDTDVMACSAPELVELAARHWAWLNDDGAEPWEDSKTEILPEPEARAAFMAWLFKQPQLNG